MPPAATARRSARPRTAPPSRPAPPPVAGWAAGVSVVVPVGPGEEAWRDLLFDLVPLLAAGGTVSLCGLTDRPPGLPRGAEWVRSRRPGRAAQMNAAAARAAGPLLWFLHADSRLTAADIRAAVEARRGASRSVGFLRLRFAGDGPAATRLNGWAANVRSRRLKMPFGDQGLFLPRELWEELGRFDEAAPYGEGHLLVWAARRAGVPVAELPAAVVTSARKYRRRGWGRTTGRHLWLTVKQAAPQWWAMVRGRD